MTTLAEFSALLRDLTASGVVLDLTSGGKISAFPPPPAALRARLIAARPELVTYLRTGRYVQDESTPSPCRTKLAEALAARPWLQWHRVDEIESLFDYHAAGGPAGEQRGLRLCLGNLLGDRCG